MRPTHQIRTVTEGLSPGRKFLAHMENRLDEYMWDIVSCGAKHSELDTEGCTRITYDLQHIEHNIRMVRKLQTPVYARRLEESFAEALRESGIIDSEYHWKPHKYNDAWELERVDWEDYARSVGIIGEDA